MTFVYDPLEEALLRLRLSRERLHEAMRDVGRELARMETLVREAQAIMEEKRSPSATIMEEKTR